MKINGMKTLAAVTVLALLLAGCASMGGGNADLKVLAFGNHSNIKDQQYTDIHNQADLDALWQKAFANQPGAPPEPMVDFSKDMVLAAFIGDQSTGGYAIRFSNIDASGDAINVTVQVTQPGQGCHHPQSSTDAYLIAATSASAKSVNFNPLPEHAPDCG